MADEPRPAQPSFPPTQEGTPPPAEENLRTKLSSLGIKSTGKPSKKTKIVLSVLALFFLLASIPAAVYLVQQRQEIRKRAAYPADCANRGGHSYCQRLGYSCCGFGTGDCYADGECSPYSAIRCRNGQWVDDASCGPEATATPTPPTGGFCAESGKTEGRDPSLPGPPDCNGIWCHDNNWNYCCWDQNGDGHWTPGVDACSRGQSRDVYCRGDCITFIGHQGETVTFLKYYAAHNVSCPYGPGTPASETITIPNNNYSKCIPANKCGQLEANNYCGVCKSTGCEEVPPPETPTPTPPTTPTPTPTLPPDTAQCDYCKVYDEEWNEITDFSTIEVGQTVYFATRGSTTDPQGITKARFRINDGADTSWCTGTGRTIVDNWCETTVKYNERFYIEYTIPSAGSYTVESEVYNPVLGWH